MLRDPYSINYNSVSLMSCEVVGDVFFGANPCNAGDPVLSVYVVKVFDFIYKTAFIKVLGCGNCSKLILEAARKNREPSRSI